MRLNFHAVICIKMQLKFKIPRNNTIKKYKGNIEYIVIRSNIQDDKVLFIDNTTKEILGTGFDELEQLTLNEMLRGDDM